MHVPLEGPLPYPLSEEQIAAYNLDERERLTSPDRSQLLRLAARLGAALLACG